MISVIVPTLNRAVLLEKTLMSFTRQDIDSNAFEILVIDNGSSDNTREVVARFGTRFSNIRYIIETKPGLHEGRHRGLLESRGDILSYADDDIDALPSWLTAISNCFENPKIGLVGGKNIPDYESEPPEWLEKFWVTTDQGKYNTYYSLLDFGDDIKTIDPHYVFGCNFSVRKSIVLNARGFHPDGMPQSMIRYRGDGETHVARHVEKSGYQTLYDPKASVRHCVPMSRMNMEYMTKRAFAEGITQSYIDTRKRFTGMKPQSRIRAALSEIRRNIKDFLLDELEKQIRKSFLAGYKYHQAELKNDKELLVWVLRESYLPHVGTKDSSI